MLDFCKPRFSEIRNWGSSWSEPMSNLQSRRPFEQSHQIHLHSSALATRSPKSGPTLRIWRSNSADWRRLPRPGPPKATNRPPLFDLGDPFRRNGRSFHDLANGRPKSVVDFTIWRTECPNRSLISCSGKQRRKSVVDLASRQQGQRKTLPTTGQKRPGSTGTAKSPPGLRRWKHSNHRKSGSMGKKPLPKPRPPVHPSSNQVGADDRPSPLPDPPNGRHNTANSTVLPITCYWQREAQLDCS